MIENWSRGTQGNHLHEDVWAKDASRKDSCTENSPVTQALNFWIMQGELFPETKGFVSAMQVRVINTWNYQKQILSKGAVIDKCHICQDADEKINTPPQEHQRMNIISSTGIRLSRHLSKTSTRCPLVRRACSACKDRDLYVRARCAQNLEELGARIFLYLVQKVIFLNTYCIVRSFLDVNNDSS